MRDRRLNRFGVAGWALQTRKLFQPILDVARGGRRSIEREMQHGGGERGGGGDHGHMVGGGKTGTKHPEIQKGVPQQRVPALEPFD